MTPPPASLWQLPMATPNVLKPSLLAPPPTTSFQTVQEKTPRLSLLARSQGTHAQAVQENPKAISLLARPPTTDVQAVQENPRSQHSSNLQRDCPSLFHTEDLSNHEPATNRTCNWNWRERQDQPHIPEFAMMCNISRSILIFCQLLSKSIRRGLHLQITSFDQKSSRHLYTQECKMQFTK